MRESESSGSVLERYEVPAMRVVPTDGGRIVVESVVSFTGDTGLGVFENDAYNWNEASATGGELGLFTNGSHSWNDGSASGSLVGFENGAYDWNVGSVDGGELGLFTNGSHSWNEASATGGELGVFGPATGQEWNGGTASSSGIGGFEPDPGATLQWSDTP